MSIPSPRDHSRTEWLAVAALAMIGLVPRLSPAGQLGLTHFDEGIYAMAGAWSLLPGGLAAIDPMVIPYAPPGFPILIGLMYGAIGRSDVAAIAVSQIAGMLAIPASAWLARRTFGPGAGFAAAALASLCGPHIAFSRMALTDASFLLAWLVAIGAGMRFLERPTAGRGVAMGLAVGLAQQFKYNGWIVGALVILASLVGLTRAEERRPRALFRTFGWGLLGAVAAAVVVLPWYRFVEAHGGYPSLLRHQRSYLGGPANWLPNFRLQADQGVALSGSEALVVTAWAVAAFGGIAFRWFATARELRSPADLRLHLGLATAGGILFAAIPNAAWWLGLIAAPALIASRRPSARLVGLWWLVLSILTPFYHPYARLWLPIHAVGWLILGGMLGDGVDAAGPLLRRLRGRAEPGDPGFLRVGLAWGWFLAIGTLWSVELGRPVRPATILPGLLWPSDSLREASRRVEAIFPRDGTILRSFGRPPLTFYLAGRVPIWPQAGVEILFRDRDARSWAILDNGVDRSLSRRSFAPRLMAGWEVVEEIPTELALPTLLDIDPRLATRGRGIVASQTVTLILYRPRPSGDPR